MEVLGVAEISPRRHLVFWSWCLLVYIGYFLLGASKLSKCSLTEELTEKGKNVIPYFQVSDGTVLQLSSMLNLCERHLFGEQSTQDSVKMLRLKKMT